MIFWNVKRVGYFLIQTLCYKFCFILRLYLTMKRCQGPFETLEEKNIYLGVHALPKSYHFHQAISCHKDHLVARMISYLPYPLFYVLIGKDVSVVSKKLGHKCTQFGETHVIAFTAFLFQKYRNPMYTA